MAIYAHSPPPRAIDLQRTPIMLEKGCEFGAFPQNIQTHGTAFFTVRAPPALKTLQNATRRPHRPT